MSLFEIPERNKVSDSALIKKSKSKKKVTTAVKSGSGSIADRVNTIKAMVEKHLGQFRDECEIITEEERLRDYIDFAVNCGKIVSIDTETTGLDPLQDELVGISLYTPGETWAYIPVGHVSYVTDLKVKNQLSLDVVAKYFQRLNYCFIIMFNAPFDLRFIWNHVGVRLHCDWDCYLASRLLNENEGAGNRGLKKLHQKYVLKGKEDAFKFDDLFKGINFAYVPINTGYLYAAHDAIITYELYKYQLPFLDANSDECKKRGLEDIAWVFHNIEMPVIDVVVDMENTGVKFDTDYAKELSVKYHAILDEHEQKFHKLCDMYSEEIIEYNASNPGVLENPINIKSTKQLAALLYDVMKLKAPIDKKTKKPTRSTNEETLKALKNDVAQAVLDYREFSTLVSTFIDKLPECVNPKDGRIHCKFNQYGADTGRFSSQDPNLQNIPSHNKDIRKMFTATNEESVITTDDDIFIVDRWSEVYTKDGWIECSRLVVGDNLDGNIIKSVQYDGDKCIIEVEDYTQED